MTDTVTARPTQTPSPPESADLVAAPAADRSTGSGASAPAVTEPRRRSAARRRIRRSASALAFALPVPIVAVWLWSLGVQNAWTLPFDIKMQHVPLPADVARRLVDLVAGGYVDDAFSGTLWEHTAASTGRVLSGFGLAVVCAVPLGIVMGRFRAVFRMLDPVITLVRPIPVTAWAPLSLLIIGIGDRSTVFLVFLAAFFPILLNTISGVRQVPPRLVEAAAMLGTKQHQVLSTIVLPASMRSIVSGLRIALGLSWVILVVGETVGIRTGLGSMITQARDMSKTDLIVAGMAVIGLAGFLADRVLVLAVKVLTRNRPTLS